MPRLTWRWALNKAMAKHNYPETRKPTGPRPNADRPAKLEEPQRVTTAAGVKNAPLTRHKMLKYLTPTTLKAMYEEIDEARLDIFLNASEDNYKTQLEEYSQMNEMLEGISQQYQASTNDQLWVIVATEQGEQG